MDIIGPIMIGPSSSHTAGAARIGKLARLMLQEPLKKAEITLYGSFAKTYQGHGTDLALLGGLLGFNPDDPRIREATALAKESFVHELKADTTTVTGHPNTVRLRLHGENGRVDVTGVSVGGGRIRITEIDGFSVNLDGESVVLVIHSVDKPGVITKLTASLGEGINIGNMSVSRQAKGSWVVMVIEIDMALPRETEAVLSNIEGVKKITQIIPL